MLADLFLLSLVLLVAVLVTMDVRRTSSEFPHEQEVIHRTFGEGADASQQEPAGAAATAVAPGADPAVRPPGSVDQSAEGRRRAESAPAPWRTTSSRFALRNWRVRSRLILLVSIPTVTAVAFAGDRVLSAAQSAAMVHGNSAAHSRAVTSVIFDSVVVLLILALALVTTTIVGRSMVRPLRRLQIGALDVAGRQLPEAVRQISEAQEGKPLEVVPIDVDSSDEIGEVARAFDQVHREALRLAANEAALRANVNAIFVNLSRRSQSLVERQIRLIDDLEQGEQDPERLSNLFQMDHLATRMRRNSENLLVLADHDISRFWNQPLALVDVLRAALSEIEQYERITLNVQPGIAVRGQAVSDVVHLAAELVENATSFSPAETPVTVAGHLLSSGGVLLEITDQGVGMGTEDMAHANWRLDNPPVVDVAVSRRMGLFVVARLAAKHGIRVRLRPATSGGLIALVWLPDEAIVREALTGSPDLRGPDPATPESAAMRTDGRVAIRWADLDRPTAQQEVKATRVPKFAPLRTDAEETSPGFRSVRWPDFRTVPQPAAGAAPEPAETGSPQVAENGEEPVTDSVAETMSGADSPAVAYQPFRTGVSSVFDGPDVGSSQSEAIVQFADGPEAGNRLPIFEAVESDWFRRGGQAVTRFGYGEVSSGTGSWTSPADEGWRAAEVVHAPSSGGVTSAGLPKRVPRANLVPGAAAAMAESPVSAPARSAAATRERFASFQQGVRKGRAAVGEDAEVEREDDASE